MKIGGLSTHPKFFLIKMLEDMIILRKYFKFFFIFVYLYKVINKLKTFKYKKINLKC
jgi:hypothetical protein